MPIDPQLRAILQPLQRKKGPVVRYRGGPVKSIKKALANAAKTAGIPYGRRHATFHSLRHTMATTLAELGIAEEQRRLVMGHSDIRTTQGYTHLRPLHERAPLAALSAAMPLQGAVQGPRTAPAKNTEQKRASGKHAAGRNRKGK